MTTETIIEKTTLESPSFPMPPLATNKKLAWQDIIGGLLDWRIWTMLSWQDIRIRYRRSQLGPFWLTLSMAITIYTMGLLYGHLFRLPIKNYFPFLAAGMLTWNLISLLIIDGTSAFIACEHFLKQLKLPYSVFVWRVISRCFIIFFHNIIVMLPLYFIFHIPITPAMLMIFPGLFLIALNAYAYGMILAITGARYRDVAQLIGSIMQVIFFITPIMWSPAILPEKYQAWVLLNPFAQYVEIVRAPMISTMPSLYALVSVLVLTIIGLSFAFYLLARVRRHIVYWL